MASFPIDAEFRARAEELAKFLAPRHLPAGVVAALAGRMKKLDKENLLEETTHDFVQKATRDLDTWAESYDKVKEKLSRLGVADDEIKAFFAAKDESVSVDAEDPVGDLFEWLHGCEEVLPELNSARIYRRAKRVLRLAFPDVGMRNLVIPAEFLEEAEGRGTTRSKLLGQAIAYVTADAKKLLAVLRRIPEAVAAQQHQQQVIGQLNVDGVIEAVEGPEGAAAAPFAGAATVDAKRRALVQWIAQGEARFLATLDAPGDSSAAEAKPAAVAQAEGHQKERAEAGDEEEAEGGDAPAHSLNSLFEQLGLGEAGPGFTGSDVIAALVQLEDEGKRLPIASNVADILRKKGVPEPPQPPQPEAQAVEPVPTDAAAAAGGAGAEPVASAPKAPKPLTLVDLVNIVLADLLAQGKVVLKPVEKKQNKQWAVVDRESA